MDSVGVRRRLRREIDKAGGLMAWCEAKQLAHGHVSEVIRGRREPPPSILKALNLERVTTYRPKGGLHE